MVSASDLVFLPLQLFLLLFNLSIIFVVLLFHYLNLQLKVFNLFGLILNLLQNINIVVLKVRQHIHALAQDFFFPVSPKPRYGIDSVLLGFVSIRNLFPFALILFQLVNQLLVLLNLIFHIVRLAHVFRVIRGDFINHALVHV